MNTLPVYSFSYLDGKSLTSANESLPGRICELESIIGWITSIISVVFQTLLLMFGLNFLSNRWFVLRTETFNKAGFGVIYIMVRLYLDPFRPKCQDVFFLCKSLGYAEIDLPGAEEM